MNIYDISKKAGVSIATVSRVINGKGNVAEATRKKVLTVIEDNHFNPNVFARGLGLNTISTIGIMCSDVMDIALAQAVASTEQELRKNGYNSILCCTGSSPEVINATVQLLLNKRVDSIVMVGSQFCMPYDNTYIAKAAEKVPIIIINGFVEAPNVYCNYCDDTSIVHDVMNKLIKQGRKDIVYLYKYDSQSGTRKKQGYLKAMNEHGLNDHMQIIHCNFSMDDITQSMVDFFKKHPCDAVLAAEDHLGICALKASLKLGKKIPEDISIIGYNNSLLSLCSYPELTSIDNRLPVMCSESIKTLIQVLRGEQPMNCSITSALLVERNTTNF